MPKLIAHFEREAAVLAGDVELGLTNVELDVIEGRHCVYLDDQGSVPGLQTVDLEDEDMVTHLWFFDGLAPRPESAIADLYEGLTMGASAAIRGMSTAAAGYEVMFERADQLLAQSGVPKLAVAGEPPWLSEEWLKKLELQIRYMADFSPNLCGYFAAGMALVLVSYRDLLPDLSIFSEIDRLGIDWPAGPPNLEDFRIEPDETGFFSVDEALAPLFDFIARSIDALPAESSLAFVAMSFSPKYSQRFCTTYAPSLAMAGMRAVRALGMLSSERYQRVLHSVLRKAGFVLADLSEPGLNVLYEVGVAHALRTPCVQIASLDQYQQARLRNPANVQSDLLLPYQSAPGKHTNLALALVLGIVRRARLARPSEFAPRAVRALLKTPVEEARFALSDVRREARTDNDLETVAGIGSLHPDPRVSTPHLMMLGIQRERTGQYELAQEALEEFLARDPPVDASLAKLYLGSVMCQLGNEAEGELLLQRVADGKGEYAAAASGELTLMRGRRDRQGATQ